MLGLNDDTHFRPASGQESLLHDCDLLNDGSTVADNVALAVV